MARRRVSVTARAGYLLRSMVSARNRIRNRAQSPALPQGISCDSMPSTRPMCCPGNRENAAQLYLSASRFNGPAPRSLPYDDRSFDCVVSTWTLCTIPDPVKALRETRRVLKPDGVFLFLEHGRSEDEKIAAWQNRLNPVQNIIGCGCNLNRKIDQIIAQAGLKIMTLDRFQMQSVPKLGGEMYRRFSNQTGLDHGRPLRSEEKLGTETN